MISLSLESEHTFAQILRCLYPSQMNVVTSVSSEHCLVSFLGIVPDVGEPRCHDTSLPRLHGIVPVLVCIKEEISALILLELACWNLPGRLVHLDALDLLEVPILDVRYLVVVGFGAWSRGERPSSSMLETTFLTMQVLLALGWQVLASGREEAASRGHRFEPCLQVVDGHLFEASM